MGKRRGNYQFEKKRKELDRKKKKEEKRLAKRLKKDPDGAFEGDDNSSDQPTDPGLPSILQPTNDSEETN